MPRECQRAPDTTTTQTAHVTLAVSRRVMQRNANHGRVATGTREASGSSTPLAITKTRTTQQLCGIPALHIWVEGELLPHLLKWHSTQSVD